MASPLVSIIVPYYTHGEFLRAAVDSALAQSRDDLEVIVIDDASPGAPATEILHDYAPNKVRVLRRDTNYGVSAARNSGGAQARGQFILPLDSDDLLAPTYLESTLPLLSDDSIGGAYTAVKSFGTEDSLYDPEWTVEGIVTGKAGALVCMLYRKQMFDQLGGYDTRWRVGEDSDFFLRGVKAGWQFKRCPEPLYLYRRHANATTASNPARDLMEMQMNIVKYHPDLCALYLPQIMQFKEDRYLKLHDEYRHLHDEFHKLLALYQNLESGLHKADSASDRSLAASIRRKLIQIAGDKGQKNT